MQCNKKSPSFHVSAMRRAHGVAAMALYCGVLAASSSNPGNIPKHSASLVLQFANLAAVAAILAASAGGWSPARDYAAVALAAALLVSALVRAALALALSLEQNMTNVMDRWDSAAVAVSSGLVLCMLFYRTFSTGFRYGVTTLQAAVLAAFVVPAAIAVPALARFRAVDRGVARKAVALSSDAYGVLRRSLRTNGDPTDRVAYQLEGDTLYVAFAGTVTSNSYDVLTDLNILSTSSPVPSASLRAKVHKGFGLLYERLRPAVLRRILADRPARVVFTGHSLGGALATIAAADVAEASPGMSVWCYTFGSPPVGDQLFVSHFNRSVAASARFVNPFDIVPHSLVAQFGHVRGYVPVVSLDRDIFPASHSIDTYRKGVDRGLAATLFGIAAPSLYIGAGCVALAAARWAMHRR